MVAPLTGIFGGDAHVLVGAESGDDAGVYLHGDEALIATVDFITPVCDDPRRFGRVAAANSISDVYAMGGRPLFALNICCFPKEVPLEMLSAILDGAAGALSEAGAVPIGGHTVKDEDLKFGLAVIGRGDAQRLFTHAGVRVGDRLVLTKPLGTGVLINAFRKDKLDAAGLEPALREMERLNAVAAEQALQHGVRGATDVTGFGLAGHALAMARSSGVTLRIDYEALPHYAAFFPLIDRGVTTASTKPNRQNVAGSYEEQVTLSQAQSDLLFDPQTSGGLLLAVAPSEAVDLVERLRESGHQAAEIGEAIGGSPRIVVA
jgi:selenide,water dikinase